jgi:CHASE1-domain containing sensor protein/tRNA A-37 threonylcarbamoyl transferase component Bud32
MSRAELAPAARSGERAALARWTRSLGGLRTHTPALLALVAGTAISVAVFFVLKGRSQEHERAAFHADAAPVVANMRSAFELPMEVLGATAAMFESSSEVTRAEFARFVKPALERHPGIRALEWIPIVPGNERAHYEQSAREDGLAGYEFRERNSAGAMVRASLRDEYLPIFFMEPGHPLVLGFDCSSEPERRASADRARQSRAAVASERIQLIDDPPSTYSIVVFQPVVDFSRPDGPAGVRGFTCEVFRVRAIAEHAIEEGLRRGIHVRLLDPGAPPEKRLLFDSAPEEPEDGDRALVLEAPLRYADRNWRIVLRAGPQYQSGLAAPPWFALSLGLLGSALLSFAWSATRIIRRLRREIHAETRMGPYTLLEKLGEGGAGVVYKARHAMLRRPTAIKLQLEPTSDPRRLARFEREVQLTSELTHPNTIAIYDYGRTEDGIFYYAMEYIEGITLEQLVQRDGPLPPARVAHVLQQVCQALAEAHSIGLVHRDIKPSNLMICRRGGIADFVKVMDFGLVKDVGAGETGAGGNRITQSATTVLGTPLYLSPEAISRPAEIDARSDLYALGAVAYYLLVGEPVFDGESVVQVLSQHLHTAPVPPRERTKRPIPPSFERLILRCLEKAPERRPPTAHALLAALRDSRDVPPWTAQEADAWWTARGDAIVRSLHRPASRRTEEAPSATTESA